VTNQATIARAIRDAIETAAFAADDDFRHHSEPHAKARAAVRCGAELAATALAHALELAPGSDARKAFLTACGVASPAGQ
jgi:hypothetical protein